MPGQPHYCAKLLPESTRIMTVTSCPKKGRPACHEVTNNISSGSPDAKIGDPICAMLRAHGFHCGSAIFDDDPALEMASGLVHSAIIDLSFTQQELVTFLRRLHEPPKDIRLALIFISVDPAVREHFYVAHAGPLLPWISRFAEIERGSDAVDNAVKSPRSERRKILHVEGNRHVAAFVSQALHVEFGIVSAPTAELAREYLAHDRFDLAILNLALSADLVSDILPTTVGDADRSAPIVLLTAQEVIKDEPWRPTGNLTTLVESVRSLLAAPWRSSDSFEEA
jgi:hypothetical protein